MHVHVKVYYCKMCIFVVLYKTICFICVNTVMRNILFISYVKPFGAVSKDTISRWLKTVMYRSGIDVNKFTSHSVRVASVSKASTNSVPVDTIMKVAGWSNAATFAKFYKKPIDNEKSDFQNAVLKL